MIILASHLPGEEHLQSDRFTITPIECGDSFDYWRGIARYWPDDVTLINVEHDMQLGDEQLDELAHCPAPLCVFAYRVHWASTGLPRSICAHSAAGRPLKHGAARADTAAIGACKLAAAARVAPLRRERWPQVELAVNDAVDGRWHVHWPEITHHHW